MNGMPVASAAPAAAPAAATPTDMPDGKTKTEGPNGGKVKTKKKS